MPFRNIINKNKLILNMKTLLNPSRAMALRTVRPFALRAMAPHIIPSVFAYRAMAQRTVSIKRNVITLAYKKFDKDAPASYTTFNMEYPVTNTISRGSRGSLKDVDSNTQIKIIVCTNEVELSPEKYPKDEPSDLHGTLNGKLLKSKEVQFLVKNLLESVKLAGIKACSDCPLEVLMPQLTPTRSLGYCTMEHDCMSFIFNYKMSTLVKKRFLLAEYRYDLTRPFLGQSNIHVITITNFNPSKPSAEFESAQLERGPFFSLNLESLMEMFGLTQTFALTNTSAVKAVPTEEIESIKKENENLLDYVKKMEKRLALQTQAFNDRLNSLQPNTTNSGGVPDSDSAHDTQQDSTSDTEQEISRSPDGGDAPA